MIRLAAIASKAVVGLGLTLVIGYIIKAEHKIDDILESYFADRQK